jgi:hypothetical protein
MRGRRHCAVFGSSCTHERYAHAQTGREHPGRTRKVTAEGIDEDLVFVKSKDDVGQPPALLALHALAILAGASRRRRRACRPQRLFDGSGETDAWRQRELLGGHDANGERARRRFGRRAGFVAIAKCGRGTARARCRGRSLLLCSASSAQRAVPRSRDSLFELPSFQDMALDDGRAR